MNPTQGMVQAKAVTQELDNVLKLFDISKNNSVIITNGGRTYRVANVLKNRDDGSWMVTQLVSRGMFACDTCGNDVEPKYIPEDTWTQFTHGEDVVSMHSGLIHTFREHPEKISEETLNKVAKIFLG